MFGLFKKMHGESASVSRLNHNINRILELIEGGKETINNFSGDYDKYRMLKNETQTVAYFIRAEVLDQIEILNRDNDSTVYINKGGIRTEKLGSVIEKITADIKNISVEVGVDLAVAEILDKGDHFYKIETTITPKIKKNWGFK